MTRRPYGLGLALALASAACVRAQAPSNPASARVENDTASLLGAGRLARLPAAERAAWTAYVETSRRMQRSDRDSMARELAALGRERMTKAPDVRQSFSYDERMTGAWLRSDSARVLLDAVLSYQVPSGGWSKHVDFWKGRRAPGQSYFSETDQWQYIATLDNNATTAEMQLLAAAWRELRDGRHRAAFDRGLEYLLVAQMPTGCWPQVFPLQGGYHDAATFNDDAIVNALEVLALVRREAAARTGLVSDAKAARAEAAERRAVDCILRSQVALNGRRTVWGQQHDPLTLGPAPARSYELAGLSGRESASIMRYLMNLDAPSDSVVAAVHAAAAWFRANEIAGFDYDYMKGRVENPAAAPLWARLTEIETGRAIFANRDGVKLYDWNQLTDRRQGYAWYGREPAAALRQYERWARRHPVRSAHD